MADQQRSSFFADDEAEQTPALAARPAAPTAPSSFFAPDPADPLRRTLGEARNTTPDQAARIFKLQLKTGLPAGLIERNLDHVEREAASRDFDADKFRRETPLLAQWLQQNPQHAQLAQDDLEPLGAIERTLRVGRLTSGALAMGPMLISEGFWGGVRAGAEVFALDNVAEFARGSAVVARHLSTKIRGDRRGVGFVEGAVYSGLESLSLMGSAAAATAFSGPAPLLAVMGTATGGQAYSQARDDGAGVGKSLGFASWQAGVEVATEMIPARWFFRDLAKNAAFKQVLKHQIKTESLGEQIATALQDLGEWVVLEENKNKTFTDYLRERPSAAAETAIATIVAVGGQAGLVRALEAASGKPASQQILEDLHDQVGQSKTQQRSSDAMHAFLQAAATDVPEVAVNGQRFVEFFQENGQDPEAIALELTGDPNALRLAVGSGGDLVIPTATYLSKMVGSGHEPFFVEELRLGPNAENAREARERFKRQAEDTAAAEATDADPTQRVYDAMVAKLTATNRYTPYEAETYATLWASFFNALASRRPDTDAATLFEKYAPAIVSEGGRAAIMPPRPAAGNVTGGIPASPAPANETREQRANRREAHLEALTSYLVRDAQQLDSNVDPEQLTEEVRFRLSLLEEQQDAQRNSGRGQDLLRAIAAAGGIWWSKDEADRGEIEHMLEGADKRVRARDKRGVRRPTGPRTWNGVAGVFREGGRSLDDMTRILMQDPKFAYLEDDLNKLQVAIDEAMRAKRDPADAFAGTADLAAVGIRPGTTWWADPTSRSSQNTDADVGVDESEPAYGDVSFDPAEFTQIQFGPEGSAPAAMPLTRRQFLEQRITLARQQQRPEDTRAVLELQELVDRGDDGGFVDMGGRPLETPAPGFNPGPMFQPDMSPGTRRPRVPTLNALAAAADGTPERAAQLRDRRAFLEQRVVEARRAGKHDIPAENELRRLRELAEREDTGQGELDLSQFPLRGTTEFNQEALAVATLTGNELGDGVEDVRELRRAGIDYYKRELQGRTAERPGFGTVRFTKKGRSRVKWFSANPDKLRVIPALPAIIERGDYLGRDAAYKTRADGIVAFHRFEAPVALADRVVTVRVLVGEDGHGNKFFDLDPVHEKTQAGRVEQDTVPGPSEDGTATPEDSIEIDGGDVNGAEFEQGDEQRPPGWDKVDTGSDGPKNMPPGKLTKGTYNPITNVIRLLKKADRSTFIHESAHFFLEVLSDVALQPDAPASLQADMATLLEWFGFEGDLQAWRALTHEERRDHHEQFARGFEAYFFEGKAPTPELQPLYARFAAWLLGLYKTLRRLNVELTPEVRQVFDRMLATDAAIAAAEADAHIAPLFTTAADAGVADVEFNGYRDQVQAASAQAQARLQGRLMRELQREQEAWWQEERAQVRAQVEAEVRDQPVYRALAAMRGELEGAPAAPLSKDFLVAQFGRDILKQLPRLYSRTSGLPPDTIAQMFGFPSGEALIESITEAPDVDELIDRLTDDRMADEHGSLLRDRQQLADAANEAIAGEHRDTVVRAELAMLNKLRAAAAPSVRAEKAEQRDRRRVGAERLRAELPDDATLRRLAEQTIANMKLGNIRPERFLAAARRGSRQATEAAAKQDFDTAIEGKQTELTNLALYRAALEARQAVEDARDRFAKMFAPDDAMAKRRQIELVQAARAIAAKYFWPERRLADAHQALAVIQKQDAELYAALEEQIVAALSAGPDLQSLTYESFQVVAEAVDALWEQSLRSQQQLVEGQLVDRREVFGQLEGRLDELGTPFRQEPRTKGQMLLLGVRAALRRVEHWVDYVDGGNPHGAFRRFIWNPVAEAADRYRVAKKQYLEKYLELLKPIEKTLVPGAIEARELGFTFESKAALLHALLHTGNDSNFQKLLRGYQWGRELADGVVDASPFRAFLARAHREGIVTKADWDFVQSVWDLLEESKGEAQKAHREMYGRYFSEITARPVPTPWGTYHGGYVPAIVDPLQSGDAAQRGEGEILNERDNAAMFPSTTRGFTKQRVERYAKPLALNLRLIPSHLDKVLRFVHLAPRVREIGRLLWSWDMRERLNAYDPTAISDLLVPWLQRTVQQRVSQPSSGWAGRASDQFWRTIRTRTGLNTMAGNVLNTLQQFTGIFPAALKVRPRYLRNGLYRYVTDHKRAIETVTELSAFMRERSTAAAIEVQKTIDDLLLNPSKYEELRAFSNRHGYFLQQHTQNVVDVITWIGAYEQASEQGADPADAVRQADSAVRMTQGSFAPEDLAAIDTRNAFTRAFVMFYGYFNMLANLNGTELAKVVRDIGLKKGAGRALYIYAFGFMAPAVVSELIRQALGGFEDDDDESWMDEALAIVFGSQFRQGAAMVPGVGPAANSVVNYFNDRPYDDRISASPAVTMVESAARAPKSVYDAIVEDGSKKRAVRDTLDVVGLLTGLPVGVIKRPAGYLADVADERADPDDALDLARGLVSGRSQTPY